MPAELMLGQPVVDAMREQLLKDEIQTTLGILQVGDLPESSSYVKQVQKTLETVQGISLHHRRIYEEIATCELQREMSQMNNDDAVSGYMLQLPLPRHLHGLLPHFREVIDPTKDIDHLGYEHGGGLFHEKQRDQILPPTPYAVMKMLQFYEVQTKGKMMAIVGDGEVGRRLKVMAGNDMANQIVLNATIPDLARWTRQADIVVSAVGVPGLITEKHVRKGATVVGVGVKFVEGKMQSDIDVESVKERAGKVTPRVGGLGPVTVMALIQNAVRAARRKNLE